MRITLKSVKCGCTLSASFIVSKWAENILFSGWIYIYYDGDSKTLRQSNKRHTYMRNEQCARLFRTQSYELVLLYMFDGKKPIAFFFQQKKRINICVSLAIWSLIAVIFGRCPTVYIIMDGKRKEWFDNGELFMWFYRIVNFFLTHIDDT